MNNPRISIVAAMANKRVIGKGNKIPWHLTPDLLRFKEKCLNHTVIMGRKTFESLLFYYQKSGRKLPGRMYIVITSDMLYRVENEQCLVVHSFDEALTKAKEVEPEEIILGGGRSIFEEGMKVADRLYLTVIDMDVAGGDTFFPDYTEFTKVLTEEKKTDWEYPYTFLTLEREKDE